MLQTATPWRTPRINCGDGMERDGSRTRVQSLGISLPCQVIPTDLRMACTVAYRG